MRALNSVQFGAKQLSSEQFNSRSSEAVLLSRAIQSEVKRSQYESVSLEKSLIQNSTVEPARVQKELERVSLFSRKPVR